MQTHDMEQICRCRLFFLSFFLLPPRRVFKEARNVPAAIPPAQAEVKVTHADLLTDFGQFRFRLFVHVEISYL